MTPLGLPASRLLSVLPSSWLIMAALMVTLDSTLHEDAGARGMCMQLTGCNQATTSSNVCPNCQCLHRPPSAHDSQWQGRCHTLESLTLRPQGHQE